MSVIDSNLTNGKTPTGHGSRIRVIALVSERTAHSTYAGLRFVLSTIVLICLQGNNLEAVPPSATGSTSVPKVNLARQPVPRLAPGTLVGHPQQSGYSNLVTLVMPRLAAGEVDSLPEYAKQYAGMFHLTVLANVKTVISGDRTDYLLDRFGVGISMQINEKLVVVTPPTANELGLNLRMIERGILKGNEKDLGEITQVARTSRMIIFDVPTNMLVDNKHKKQILRYFVWASPASGKLGVLVWRLTDTKSGQYTIESKDMQLLPPNYTEDREIHVSKGPLLSNIPTANRFALVSLPQGTSVPFSPRMRTVAGLKTMNVQNLHTMMAGTSESLALVPEARQAKRDTSQRK